jgi:hypothetical protein
MNRQNFPSLAHLLRLQISLVVKSGVSRIRSHLLTRSYSPLHSSPLSLGESPAQGTKTIHRNKGATRHPLRCNGTNGNGKEVIFNKIYQVHFIQKSNDRSVRDFWNLKPLWTCCIYFHYFASGYGHNLTFPYHILLHHTFTLPHQEKYTIIRAFYNWNAILFRSSFILLKD